MANAKKDSNNVSTLIAPSSSDGATIVLVKGSASTHQLFCSDGVSGTDFGPANALRDQNDIPTLLAISNADGVTPVAVYSDSTGRLLIDSI